MKRIEEEEERHGDSNRERIDVAGETVARQQQQRWRFVTSERSLYVEASEHLRDFDYFIRVRQLSQPSRHGFIERVANQINSIKMRNVLFIFADYQHHLFVLIVCVSTVLSWRPLLRLRRGEKIKERKKMYTRRSPSTSPLPVPLLCWAGYFKNRFKETEWEQHST